MNKKLVIVESPTKAKTISKFLGNEYNLESSFGHIRDLPKRDLGVDVEHGFQPTYVIPKANSKRVANLKKLAAKAEEVYFATDEDREGEAISWHLQDALGVPEKKSKRIAFHEITREAVEHALNNPRKIDLNLVNAQQARRILDRLVGYKLSPLLWKKIAKGLSAGRVQSIAVRLIVEREREILDFKAQEYWTVEIELQKKDGANDIIKAKLSKIKGKTVDKFQIKNEEEAKKIINQLNEAIYKVDNLEVKDTKRATLPPFTTSSLQQDANRRLRFSPKQTMMIAQQLYEGVELGKHGAVGLITYMRTDSVNLAEKFLGEAHDYIKNNFDSKYLISKKYYQTKSKLAQEAHEAIRPTSIDHTPDSIKNYLSEQQFKLYDLIWRRSLACQMPDAIYQSTSIDIIAQKGNNSDYLFKTTGQFVKFDGFTKVYPIDSEEIMLPGVTTDEVLDLQKIDPIQHYTKPPARYSEAGLVKVLEENGIGRPSTYAPTISTILDRGYVEKEDRRLKPTELAFLVNDLLVNNFSDVVDYKFTAHMEDNLDKVAEGKEDWVQVLQDFYKPFKMNLDTKEKELKKEVVLSDEVCEKCGKPLAIKVGRYGKFLACTGFPECKNTKPLSETDNAVFSDKSDSNNPQAINANDAIVESADPCEKCGSKMIIKEGRYGKFLACSNYPDCKNIRSLKDKKLGIKCPDCGQGDVVQKKSRKGKMFYACNRYPDCKYISWTKPEGGEEEKKEEEKI